MSFEVRTLATRKHRETAHAELDWFKALDSARTSLIKWIGADLDSLERFAIACRSPAQFTVLVRLIYQYGRSHPKGDRITELMINYVNDSPFALADWLSAIEIFHGWLVQRARKIDFKPMLEYLECCAAAPGAREAGQSLVSTLQDMLATHGYNG